MKLGIASESAKAIVDGEEEGASKALLSDYSITPGTNLPQRTPRTPAQQDTVLQVCAQGYSRDLVRVLQGLCHLNVNNRSVQQSKYRHSDAKIAV